jgi:hypothetical protein
MGVILLRIVAVLMIYLFGSMAYTGLQEYQAASDPLPALAKTEPSMWNLLEEKQGTDYKHYALYNGKQTFKICEDTRGYIECSRFMSKRVQGVCPSAAKSATRDKASCDQFLGRRLEAEPLVVAYNGNDLVAVSRPNGEQVLSPSEWAEARKDSLERKALWQMGTGILFALLALCAF